MNRLFGAILNYIFNEWITHIPVHFIRRGFLRIFNKKISKSAIILLHVRILNFWKLTLGENSIINQYCLLDCRRYCIKIGKNSDIGSYTRIWTLGHNPDSSIHEVKGGDVIIKDNVWIASGVTILPGLLISKGVVIASGSVVTKSIDILTIVGGNPAKEIRKRKNDLTYKIKYKPLLD